MKLSFWFVALIPMMVHACAPDKQPPELFSTAQEQATSESSFQDRLSWLCGTWVRTTSRGTSYEGWRTDDSGLTGFVFRLEGRDTLISERLWILSEGQETYYIAHPSQNKEPTRFRLVESDSLRFVFENAAHDFPTRITYHHNPPDSFVATISGPSEQGRQEIDFRFKRSE